MTKEMFYNTVYDCLADTLPPKPLISDDTRRLPRGRDARFYRSTPRLIVMAETQTLGNPEPL